MLRARCEPHLLASTKYLGVYWGIHWVHVPIIIHSLLAVSQEHTVLLLGFWLAIYLCMQVCSCLLNLLAEYILLPMPVSPSAGVMVCAFIMATMCVS